MSPTANLAVVLRQAVWDLDHVAFLLPEGKISRDELDKLADNLVRLVEELRKTEVPS